MRSAKATLKKWKESASVILVAKTLPESVVTSGCNYKILTLKRSAKSSVMPDSHVFPGGKMDKSDTAKDWLKLYERFGFTADTFQKLIPEMKREKLSDADESNSLPKHISLRITAIRETFEECGILMCGNNKINNYDKEMGYWANSLCNDEILQWRIKVMKDPSQFYQLCSEFDLYPDLWCLNEWSNWLTPSNVQVKFDTMFFLAAFQELPPTWIDNKEIQGHQQSSPLEYIIKSNNKAIVLPPPQFYELLRLQIFSDINQLLKFANTRAKHGTEKYQPYRINTDSGVIMLLPGDDLYPELDVLQKEEPIYIKTLQKLKSNTESKKLKMF